MLLKLAVSGMKGRLREYSVLLSGLMMSSAIFYMFETLALNEKFLKSSTTISSVMIIFQLGAVLLSIITFFYVIYANSFLVSLRQREFGLYQMLGVKRYKVAILMMIETLIVGSVALILGSIVGTALSAVVGKVLMSQLQLPNTGYQAFYLPALGFMFAFYLCLFVIAGIKNAFYLYRQSLLSLLNSELQSEEIKKRGVASGIQGILSLILIGIGYITLVHIRDMREFGIGLAMVTVTAGTYLLFHSLFPLLIQFLSNRKRVQQGGLSIFTYAQLKFRMSYFTKVLGTVAMLIALAVGAITVGFGFKENAFLQAEDSDYYDAYVFAPTAKEEQLLQEVSTKDVISYQYKLTPEHKLYFNVEEINQNKPKTLKYSSDGGKTKVISLKESAKVGSLEKSSINWQNAFYFVSTLKGFKKENVILASPEDFAAQTAQAQTLKIVKSNDFKANVDQFKQIQKEEDKKVALDKEMSSNKYVIYKMMSDVFNGLVFMGLFLGIAFLAMMASTLMFRVLTNTTIDQRRYKMLYQIGVARKTLKKSLRKEIGYLFLFPAIVGSIHVLVGLQMFKLLMVNPYVNIWIPFTLFIVIYLFYYLLTIWLYQRMVIPKTLEKE